MGLHIYQDFFVDLRNAGDAKFARRVLAKIFDSSGRFVSDSDDHRYHGIEDAWIRYISQGGAAYRVIYIRKGADTYLYRAGPHSVEDNLSPPSKGQSITDVSAVSVEMAEIVDVIGMGTEGSRPSKDLFLKNYTPNLLRNRILGRRLIRHREVILISPFLSEDLFAFRSPFSKVISDIHDDGATITLITLPPKDSAQFQFFEKIDSDGIEVLFHDRLHAKLYLFDVEPDAYATPEDARQDRLAIIGSANLTKKGFGIPGGDGESIEPNEELSYELPPDEFDHALHFAAYLTVSAKDLVTQRIQLAQSRKKHYRSST